MKLRRIITKRIDHQGDGFNVRAALDAVIAANVNERSGATSASSEQHIVQRSKRTTTTPGDEQEATDE
jgi:hypothetical protein